MAKANVILLNSILWNLREVTKLAEKIKKRYGDVDCTSWRYPLTSCSELEIFKLLQNNRNLDNYTYILELTYDRLLYLFNLMIKYLESSDSMEKFRPNKNVCRPKTLSLASVLHMIWDRIQAQTESLNRSVLPDQLEMNDSEKILCEKELNDSKSSTFTQSEISCISLCSCCEMVQKFVTQLVLDMERVLQKQDICSAISNERIIMREYLTEMTNWSVMSRWLTAIIKDFTTLSEKVEQVTVNSRKLRHRLDSGDRKMKLKTEQHEEEIRRVELKLRDSESKMVDLKQKLVKLNEENNQLKEEVRLKNSDLTANSLDFENKIAELKRSYEKKLKEKRENKQKEDQERQIEFKKLEKMESQNKKLEETILKLKEDLATLNMKTAKDKESLMNALKDLENKINVLKQENVSLNSVIEEKQKTIQDYSKRIMEAFPELSGTPTPKYKETIRNMLESTIIFYTTLQDSNTVWYNNFLESYQAFIKAHQIMKQKLKRYYEEQNICSIFKKRMNYQGKVQVFISVRGSAERMVGQWCYEDSASGNPETDMENQIEANKLRMKQIELENQKLQKTLDKIKAMKG